MVDGRVMALNSYSINGFIIPIIEVIYIYISTSIVITFSWVITVYISNHSNGKLPEGNHFIILPNYGFWWI